MEHILNTSCGWITDWYPWKSVSYGRRKYYENV